MVKIFHINKLHYIITTFLLTCLFLYSCQDNLNNISQMPSESVSARPFDSNILASNSNILKLNISERTGNEFKVFDATGFKGKPKMSRFGIRPMDVIYPYELWKTKRNRKNRWEFIPGSQAAKAAHKAARLKSRDIMVNVHYWPTHKDPKTTLQSMRRYSTLYYDMKRAEPIRNFGYLHVLPVANHWKQPPSQKTLKHWKELNDRLKVLAKKVNIFYLPGYTDMKDQKQWVYNMKHLINEAKRIGDGQPIYVVLWPQYSSRSPKNLKGKYVSKDFWQVQLETAKQYADGIVLYAPYGTPWDGSAPWWDATKKFMEEIGEYTAEPKASDAEFKVFDETRFRHKPEMTRYGFTPLEGIYQNQIWGKSVHQIRKWELPSEKLVKKWAHKASEVSDIAMVDIEHWPNSGSNLDRSLNNFSTVYKWFKEAEPNMEFGFFNMVPRSHSWYKYPLKKWITSMKKANDRLRPLANTVDVYFPCAYTVSKDKEAWVLNTKYMIKQAHKYNGNKPVYLYLWPQYHAPNNPKLDDKYIGKDFWQLQLETARKYADGVVIWFPYKTKWSEAKTGPWWEVTKQFLRDLGKAN